MPDAVVNTSAAQRHAHVATDERLELAMRIGCMAVSTWVEGRTRSRSSAPSLPLRSRCLPEKTECRSSSTRVVRVPDPIVLRPVSCTMPRHDTPSRDPSSCRAEAGMRHANGRRACRTRRSARGPNALPDHRDAGVVRLAAIPRDPDAFVGTNVALRGPDSARSKEGARRPPASSMKCGGGCG